MLETARCSPPRSSDPPLYTLPDLCSCLSHSCSFFFFLLMDLRLLTSLYPGLWLYFIFKYLFTYMAAPGLPEAHGVFSRGVRSLSGGMRDLLL